ncbi:DUF6048 family protein [Polaribacter dokdonensis]|uniref:Outer membrane protein beta-barrel domain-containing protein n=1 Tax=Polaribacter dokdonensis DSW-5 TaxID=1300348 RepID=A0A0M9CGV3_9FLAO|nr:DUF6048 family protein [Polaribacter dokdonensis]KOY52371.1 hypothetical protein I602_1931 [Polaribacter dokdonensis DSW-5]SEE44288.1 hypothetical protein SAMN05444353_1700 [Polaribacter dokdonensis DSW-5]
MYKFIISLIVFFVFASGFAQETEIDKTEIEQDSIVYKTAYGLRLGADISKPIKSAIDGFYNSGFEIVGDYRISKRFYVAAELGYEDETSQEDYTNSRAKGSYVRLGFNYNAYDNWLDMNNEIFVGYRYGFSLFEQTLNSYTPNIGNEYFPATTVTPNTTADLNAHWSELMVGAKVETFSNLFVGFSFSYKILMSGKEQEGFKTLYSPGFNRIFDSGTGFGFNYTISYLIPFSKK